MNVLIVVIVEFRWTMERLVNDSESLANFTLFKNVAQADTGGPGPLLDTLILRQLGLRWTEDLCSLM